MQPIKRPSLDGPLSAGSNTCSGSGLRPGADAAASFGWTLNRGKRTGMEDYLSAEWILHPQSGQVVGLFGVYDGHGGPSSAEFVNDNLLKGVMNHASFPSNVSEALVDSYHDVDAKYIQSNSGSKYEDGTTAVTAVVFPDRVVVANVGDSRAVLCHAGKAVPMSVDHKPNRTDERQRIEKSGGCVAWAGTWRVAGVLAVSRAIGDKPLKKYVISTPHVCERVLQPEDEFLILASDGLWDVMSNEDACRLIRDIPDDAKAAQRLADEAIKKGSYDNISVVVVRFSSGPCGLAALPVIAAAR